MRASPLFSWGCHPLTIVVVDLRPSPSPRLIPKNPPSTQTRNLKRLFNLLFGGPSERKIPKTLLRPAAVSMYARLNLQEGVPISVLYEGSVGGSLYDRSAKGYSGGSSVNLGAEILARTLPFLPKPDVPAPHRTPCPLTPATSTIVPTAGAITATSVPTVLGSVPCGGI